MAYKTIGNNTKSTTNRIKEAVVINQWSLLQMTGEHDLSPQVLCCHAGLTNAWTGCSLTWQKLKDTLRLGIEDISLEYVCPSEL
jgi:hypothetical protein